ncbi:MAG: S-methyl-5'-thioadenosine phosphorylase, partial [Spirochaetia bacterium]|nr:S-methyl-5'-thioadenosine phosphorylase [Spirochaetia bacterium]
DPFCARLAALIEAPLAEMGIPYHTGETLICMEGPAFSSRAESNFYRSIGAGLINMSALPEAKLAREAEICYALVCMSTDYDCWREADEDVTINMVVENLSANAGNAQNLIARVLPLLGKERNCPCAEASKYAVITAEDKWPAGQRTRLKAILPDYF